MKVLLQGDENVLKPNVIMVTQLSLLKLFKHTFTLGGFCGMYSHSVVFKNNVLILIFWIDS